MKKWVRRSRCGNPIGFMLYYSGISCKAKYIFNDLKFIILCVVVVITLVLRGCTLGTAGSAQFSQSDAVARIRQTEQKREIHKRLDHFLKKDPHPLPLPHPHPHPHPHQHSHSDPHSELEQNTKTTPYSLGAKISDWNEQRAAWLNRNPRMHLPVATPHGGNPRIHLVTGSSPEPCEKPLGAHYLVKSIKNKLDYCRLYGIELFYNMAQLDPEMTGYWIKLPLLRSLMLAHPEVEWFWWMDMDAMFTDMAFQIPMHKYTHHNLVLHGSKEQVYENKNWVGLNTGNFLLRNCQWSLDLLDAWAPMGPAGSIRIEAGKLLARELTGRPAFEADDQSALVYLLTTEREKWAEKVYLESSYSLHGFWVPLVEKYEEMMQKHQPGSSDIDNARPFVTHFVGCKPCGSYATYPAERCFEQMERAFNFADNQILQIYGYQHHGLGSAQVIRTRNDNSSHPLTLRHRSTSRADDDLKLLLPPFKPSSSRALPSIRIFG